MNLQPKESEIQAAIIQAFKVKHRITLIPIDAGGKGFRGASGGRGHSGIPEGFPDLFGVIPGSGVALFIEVKRPGCKPNPKQREFLNWLESQGAVAFWAASVDSALHNYDEATKWRATA